MTDYKVTDTEMKTVADAIRAKGGTTAPLAFPDGMKTAIDNIQAGCGPDLTFETLYEFTNIPKNGFQYSFDLVISAPNVESVGDNAFSDSPSLSMIFLSIVESIGNNAFSNCPSLKVVFIEDQYIVATAGADILSGSDLAKVYVPDNLVDQYKVATNWSQYADRILPISQLPL